MSEFRTHVRTGLAVHACLTAGASLAYLAAAVGEVCLLAVAGCLPVTLVGAVVPDVDHHASIPARLVRRYGPGVVAGGLSLVLYVNRRTLVAFCGALPVDVAPAYLAGLATVGGAVVGYYGTDHLLPYLRPPHRGTIHRVPVLLVTAGGVGVCALVASVALSAPRPVAAVVAVAAAGTFLAGGLSHLYRDGMLGERKTYLTVR
jgi:hypothetical protein